MLTSVTAKKLSEGLYQAALPNPVMHAPISMAFIKESLSALSSTIEVACQADEKHPLAAPQACFSIAATMASTGIGAALVPKFIAACEAAVIGLKITCKAKGMINLPTPEAVQGSGGEVVKSVETLLIDMIPNSILNSTAFAYTLGIPGVNFRR